MIATETMVEQQLRIFAAWFEVDEVSVRPYDEGPLHYSPDWHRVDVAERFTVRVGNEKRHFITPVEWELVDNRSWLATLLGAKPRYRLKDQTRYIERMIRQCRAEIVG